MMNYYHHRNVTDVADAPFTEDSLQTNVLN